MRADSGDAPRAAAIAIFASTFLDRQPGELGDQDDAYPDRDESEDRQQRKQHGVDVESRGGLVARQNPEPRSRARSALTRRARTSDTLELRATVT